ncbi:V-type ATP synthase subunit D [Ekhidna sp.]|uniref:V-type ATP synthase subunit D n=1 Tax=Ekhidna sp. TaxID=2608089 RepID=UPI003B501BF4
MALKFQYNKTTIQSLKKQLAIRQKALPILKNKETALRLEVKKRQKLHEKAIEEREKLLLEVVKHAGFWIEMPKVFFIEQVDVAKETIVGVKVPKIQDIRFRIADFSWWNYPAWVPAGVAFLKEATKLDFTIDILEKQLKLLDDARKKTTQKVNLYEKVQIPEMEQATIKIKRFLEDKENISKAGQKIIKNRKVQEV